MVESDLPVPRMTDDKGSVFLDERCLVQESILFVNSSPLDKMNSQISSNCGPCELSRKGKYLSFSCVFLRYCVSFRRHGLLILREWWEELLSRSLLFYFFFVSYFFLACDHGIHFFASASCLRGGTGHRPDRRRTVSFFVCWGQQTQRHANDRRLWCNGTCGYALLSEWIA